MEILGQDTHHNKFQRTFSTHLNTYVMNTIKIVDCNENEQNLNVGFIYNVTSSDPGFNQPMITEISLHHKGEKQPFAVFKTYESANSILLRLEAYN